MTCLHGWNWRENGTCPMCENEEAAKRHIVRGMSTQSGPDNRNWYEQGRADGLRRGRLVGMLIGVTLMTLVYFIATWRP